MEKKDPTGHKVTTTVLSDLIKGLDKLIKDQTRAGRQVRAAAQEGPRRGQGRHAQGA